MSAAVATLPAVVMTQNATPPSPTEAILAISAYLDAWAIAAAAADTDQDAAMVTADIVVLMQGLSACFSSGVRSGNNIVTGATAITRVRNLQTLGELP